MSEPSAELAIADCECGWGEDLTFYYDDTGFVGWRRDSDDDREPMRQPHRLRQEIVPGTVRILLTAALQCPECEAEFEVVGDEAHEAREGSHE